MHMQVEADVRQGLRMMKYVVNHTQDFSAPFNAFLVGLLQFCTGLGTELVCVGFLSTLNVAMDVIIRYMALSSIARVDDVYAGCLPPDNRIKGKCDPLPVKNHRRGLAERLQDNSLGFEFRIARFAYKTIRIFYSSYVFYFFPYTTLIVPYIAEWYR